MMRNAVLALLAGIALQSPAATAQSLTTTCDAPDDASGNPVPLAHVAAALQPGSTLNVLAIGSASLLRPEASIAPGSLLGQAARGAASTSVPPAQIVNGLPSETAFPQQMARRIEQGVPGLKVAMTVRGGRGLSASDQYQILSNALAESHYNLVIWQTGTVEAVRNSPPSEFAQTLTDGADKAEQAGANVVLIDPQYSRFLQTNTNIEPYEQAFQLLASMPGVLLFHRYDLMRSWVNDGQMDLERTPKPSRKQAVEQLHACLGAQLARLVLAGANSAAHPPQ